MPHNSHTPTSSIIEDKDSMASSAGAASSTTDIKIGKLNSLQEQHEEEKPILELAEATAAKKLEILTSTAPTMGAGALEMTDLTRTVSSSSNGYAATPNGTTQNGASSTVDHPSTFKKLSSSTSASTASSKISPETTANWLSKLTFWWLNSIMRLGTKRALMQSDMYEITPEFDSKYLSDRFEVEWKVELEKEENTKSTSKPYEASATWALYRIFRVQFWLAGICIAMVDGLQFFQPILLEWILTFLVDMQTLGDDAPPAWHGYLFAAALGTSPMLASVLSNIHFRIMQTMGLRTRTILVTQLYKKALRLSPSAKQAMSVGQIVNMMSTDATKIDGFLGYAHFGWAAIEQIIIAVALLIRAIGLPALAGIGVIIVLFPIQGMVFSKIDELRSASINVSDIRVKLMNEILQGIRVIKVYAYEGSFLQKMLDIRTREISFIRRTAFTRAFNFMLMSIGPTIMTCVAFFTVGATQSNFKPEYIFQAVVLFELLRMPLMMFPMVLSEGISASIGMKRINKFLKAEELRWQPEYVTSSEFAVKVENAKFEWEAMKEEAKEDGEEDEKKKPEKGSEKQNSDASEATVTKVVVEKTDESGVTAAAAITPVDVKIEVQPFHLDDVNITIPRGSLTVIVGSVGAGKSSLLAGILGEMKRVRGAVKLSGSVGYCPQQAWIQNATLKENILFGLPFDRVKYADAIKYSALEADINVLPARDLTEIGEKGINLSGGQKQRVNLARAIYFDADIVMFDDPLSAVDAHVSKYLFNECIQQKLKNKTRILVTHQLQYVSSCDHVLFIENGKITESGSYTQLMAKKGNFFTLMSTYVGEEEEEIEEQEEQEDEEKSLDTLSPPRPKSLTTARSSSMRRSTYVGEKKLTEAELKKLKAEKDAAETLMQEEERRTGGVPLKVYLYYAKHAGPVGLFFAFLFMALYVAGSNYSSWWLNLWTADEYHRGNGFYMIVLAGLAVFQAIFLYASALCIATLTVRAAYELHTLSFSSVIRAPMSFFDTTPIGRIINRFSKDQSVLDDHLMDLIQEILVMILFALGTLTMIAYVTPWFLIPLMPILAFYYIVQRDYRKTSRELKRLESISRSPLLAHFSETLTGLSTIRAYRSQSNFSKVNEERMNYNNQPYYLQTLCQRWLSLRVECIGAMITFFAAIILITQRHNISAGEAGVSLTYATGLTGMLNWMVRQIVEAENSMNSVERSMFYTNEIAQEAPATIAEADEPLKTTWPKEGAIEFSDLKIRYRDNLPLVLHGISLSIRGGERIGVVGRTGAGKSSLMVALFRLVEAAHGQISIDGIDISKIGLDALRNKLAIIPQDAVLYSGTIRSNLDPFSKYTDFELWSALEKSHLKDMISSLEKKLLDPVSEGGENFSVGQRCQICLARAILRNAKILIMDEATASVDMATDAYIQNSLRKNFNCTLLTIAHRLNTIVDYDRVLVLSFGRVQEFDSPANLLRNPNSAFSAMVNETGEVNAALLRTIAFKAERGVRVDASEVLAASSPADLSHSPLILSAEPSDPRSSVSQVNWIDGSSNL